jgi:two-component system, OmpR family, heavy metal sensor histidine kinase CusS
MRFNSRSLRIRLCYLYIVFSLTSMICLGGFSYWYLSRALASSRQHTMEAREQRVIQFVNSWPKQDASLTLAQKLQQLSLAVAPTNIIQVYALNGEEIYSSPGAATLKVPWPNRDCFERCYGLIWKNGHAIRTLDHVVRLEGHQVRLSLSGLTDEHFGVLMAVRNSYLLVCPLLLLAAVVGGFVLSGRALEPVSRITAEAREIGIQDLKRRIPVPDTGDELQILAETWNELLSRLQVAVERLTQFTSDISHDLSTTITIMMTTAGLALSKKRSSDEYRTALHTISVECDATSQLLDTLLAIARADLVHQKIEWRAVNLTEIVNEVCQQFEAGALVKRQLLRFDAACDIWIRGDQSLLRRAIAILLDNAIKYTPEAGSIIISLTQKGRLIELQVRDTGIGIPADDLPKIFDRFYRVDDARNQNEGSSGLGLAIAKWVVEAHQSKIAVDSTPGVGSTFTVSIPAAVMFDRPERGYIPVPVG